MQYEFDFDDVTDIRNELVKRAKEDATIQITRHSKYLTPDRYLPRDEKTAYMRFILEEEYQKPASQYSDKQVFAIYSKLQEQKINKLVLEQMPSIETKSKQLTQLTNEFEAGTKSLTEIVLENAKQNKNVE